RRPGGQAHPRRGSPALFPAALLGARCPAAHNGSMQRVDPAQPLPLYSSAATRQLERAAAAQLAPHTLMQRAGAAVARLARALAPHARTIWVACGRGNNGGDGLEAAALLHAHGLPVVASLLP